MKSLQLNPQRHEISFSAFDINRETKHDPGLAQISFTLLDKTGELCMTKKEMLAVSKWFARLAKRVSKKEKK